MKLWTEVLQRWRPGGRGLLSLAVLAIVAMGACYVLLDFQEFKGSRPATYADVEIGAPREDVVYRLGEPAYVLENPRVLEDDEFPVQLMHYHAPWGEALPADKGPGLPENTDIRDYPEWGYEGSQRSGEVTVAFRGGKVLAVSCSARGGQLCPERYGVGIGDAETDVVDRLGKPNETELARGVKTLRYGSLGLHLGLERQKVFRLEVVEPQDNDLILFRRYFKKFLRD